MQCAPETAKILNAALRNTREIASQFSLSFFVLWTHIFSLLAHREFWYMPSTPRSSARPIFPRDGPFFRDCVTFVNFCTLNWSQDFVLFRVVSMKTSAARRPEAFLTNSHAYSTLPLNFSHFRFGLTAHQSDGASKHTFCLISQEDRVVQIQFKPSTRTFPTIIFLLAFRWNLRLLDSFQFFKYTPSGRAVEFQSMVSSRMKNLNWKLRNCLGF